MAKNAPSRLTIGAKLLYNSFPAAFTQRSRRRRLQIGVVAGPSSSVLSLLATISAASSTVDGSPLVAQPTPPPFLCPYIACDNHERYAEQPPPSHLVAETSFSVASLTPTPTHKHHKRQRNVIADKFVRGPDGLYRMVHRYTLYGSTVCADCDPTSDPDADDVVQTSAIITSSSAPQSSDDGATVMPSGWTTQTIVNSSRVTIILTTSLVLAFFICIVMISIVMWRSKKRRRGDEEIRLRRRKRDDVSEHQDLVGKEARVKQELWARASARWKAAVRSSARRRRSRRRIAATQTPLAHSTVSLYDIVFSAPRSTSRPCSPRLSTVSSVETRSSGFSNRLAAGNVGPTISVPCSTDPETSSPPAYIHGRSPTPNPAKLDGPRETYSPDNVSQPIHHDGGDQPRYFSVHDDPIPYDASYHAGHIATDDKVLLARMAHMVSAPPQAADDGESSNVVISAPVWDYDELDGVIENTLGDISNAFSSLELSPSTSSIPFFPAPPSKGEMAAPNFYDYPYSFEEDIGPLDAETEPSAPPFAEHDHSALPLEEADMAPSAPPLLDELAPSAPAWDGEDEDIGQGHDRARDAP